MVGANVSVLVGGSITTGTAFRSKITHGMGLLTKTLHLGL